LLRQLWQHRGLVLLMTRVQYKLRFRQSVMGISWAILQPLATLGVAALVFDRVAKVNTGGVSYVTFAMAAIVPWTFFANSLMFGVPSFLANLTVLTRLSFPRAAIPLSMVGASLIDIGVSGAIFAAFAYGGGSGVPATAVWTPLLVLIELVLVVGLVLLGSAVNVFARDVRLAVPVAVQLLLFVTPVMYPLASVPAGLRPWYQANPMTGLVESFRRVLVTGQVPTLGLLVPSIVGAMVVLVLGTWYFGATETRFADVV